MLITKPDKIFGLQKYIKRMMMIMYDLLQYTNTL